MNANDDNKRADLQMKEQYMREDELKERKHRDRANAMEEIKKWRQDYVNMKKD